MSYRVRYTNRALEQLARLWKDAPDRAAVTEASHAIERLLTADPFSHSESRAPGYRVIMVKPLSVQYHVSTATRTVTVIWFHVRVDRPPHP